MKCNYYTRRTNEAKFKIAERNTLSPLRPKQALIIDQVIRPNHDPLNCVEITITFKPSLLSTTDMTLRHMVKKSLQNCITRGNALLLHEYSDTGRFHYHGILSNVSKKELSIVRKQFSHYIGLIEIKAIAFIESYYRYMTKDCDELDYDPELNIAFEKV